MSVSGNFVTDIILNVTEVDCVILNSGTLRSDCIHPPGTFKMKVTGTYDVLLNNEEIILQLWKLNVYSMCMFLVNMQNVISL